MTVIDGWTGGPEVHSGQSDPSGQESMEHQALPANGNSAIPSSSQTHGDPPRGPPTGTLPSACPWLWAELCRL